MSEKKIKDKCKNWCADCKAFDWSYCTEKYEVEKPMENKQPKKKICVNCKHGGTQFKLGGVTHLHCEHPKNKRPESPYDTLMEFYGTCKDFEQKNQPTNSELDLYINSIVSKLRDKYGYADRNRLSPFDEKEENRVVKFCHYKYTYGQWMMRGAKRSEMRQRVYIEIPYTELEESMRNKTLPKQIEEIL